MVDKIETIDLNSPNKNINTGSLPGIELLMNEKKLDKSRPSTPVNGEVNIADLNKLESELNELSEPKKSLKNAQSDLFSIKKETNSGPEPIKLDIKPIEINNNSPIKPIPLNIKNPEKKNETWDGFKKFNDIPISDPEKQPVKKLNHEEELREKFKYLRKLETIEKKGVKLSKNYTMESSLMEMQGEYETHLSERETKNSVKFQGKMLMAAITGLEFLNNRFDPFDLKLDGWSEQVNENIDDYDDIFGELHEKYKSKASLAPEIKLLFQLGGSAVMLHMTNTMFKSAMPGMDDIMKQNPELMQQFTQAAVNSMGESNPGFGNFMNNFVPGNNDIPTPNMGTPPPPLQTQTAKSQRYAPPTNRPDLTSSKTQAGISIQEKFSPFDEPQQIKTPAPQKRAEMKGPSDISQLLSGLKSKQVNVTAGNNEERDPSTVSISELKELSSQKQPKSNRKQSSSKSNNTISLDL